MLTLSTDKFLEVDVDNIPSGQILKHPLVPSAGVPLLLGDDSPKFDACILRLISISRFHLQSRRSSYTLVTVSMYLRLQVVMGIKCPQEVRERVSQSSQAGTLIRKDPSGEINVS